MSPVDEVRAIEGLRFPRVSGDEPHMLRGNKHSSSFSPRERG